MKNSINIDENFSLSCSKSREKLNKAIINYLLLDNNKIKDIINRNVLQIENTIKNNSTNPLIIQLKDVYKDLYMVMEEINKNNKIIFKLLNDKNNGINNDIIIINNDLNDINKNQKLSDIQTNKIVDNKENNLLLNTIKSNHIMKILFSYLKEGNKLKIVKYNKNIQNKIGIKLINYK